jgi:hypothetical protein
MPYQQLSPGPDGPQFRPSGSVEQRQAGNDDIESARAGRGGLRLQRDTQSQRQFGGERRPLGRRMVGVVSLATVCFLGVIGSGAFLDAAGATTTLTVNTTVDENLAVSGGTTCVATDGFCSFRAAIQAADNLGGGVIDIPAGTYTLSLGVLDVGSTAGSTIDIVGLDTPTDTTIQQVQPAGCTGGGTTGCQQVFSVDPSGAGGVSFALSNVTVTGGATSTATTPTNNGAAISAGGSGDSTSLTDDAFTDNGAVGNGQNTPGGAVSQQGGDLAVAGCTFSQDSAGKSSGGAIDFESADGKADALTVTASSFTNDSSSNPSGGGGAVYLDDVSAPGSVTATITGSTFSGDTASGGTSQATGGGAILVESGTLNAFSDNFLGDTTTAGGTGGAVNVVGGTTTVLAGDRFVGNAAASSGGQTVAADSPNLASVSAEDDWWASQTGPSAVDLTGGVAAATYLQLRDSVSVSPVVSGDSTVVTSDLTHDQSDVSYTVHAVPDGTPVTFGGTAGSYPAGTSGSTLDGTASDTMTAGPAGMYPEGATTTVDSITANAAVDVTSATEAGISLVKSASVTSFSGPGTGITYFYKVTNTGGVTLDPVVVADPMSGLSGMMCPNTSLVAGAQETCTATYTTTVADVTAGQITNIGMASGTPSTGPVVTATSNTVTIPFVAPTCFIGPWPAQLTGFPSVPANGSPPPGFFIGLQHGLWKVYSHSVSLKHFHVFTGTITTDGVFSGVQLSGDSRGHLTTPDSHTISFRFTTRGSFEGVKFTTTCGSTLTFTNLEKDGSLVPPGQILLGNPATPAASNPVTFSRPY